MRFRNEINPGDKKPRRAHYPWWELEENLPDGGMWSTPTSAEREGFITAAEKLMLDAPAFADAMRRALVEWPRSVEVALTNPSMNHRAWIGHAGCYLATGSPEETTRLGWHRLDEAEQFAANLAADTVIAEWRAGYVPQARPLDWDED